MEAVYVTVSCVVYIWLGACLTSWAERRNPDLKYFEGWAQGSVIITLCWPLVIIVSFIALIKRLWDNRDA